MRSLLRKIYMGSGESSWILEGLCTTSDGNDARPLLRPAAGRKYHRLRWALTTISLIGLTAAARSAEPLQLAQTIPIPDVAGRMDHMAIDVKGRRLFVAALENNTVEVIDLRGGKWLRSLSGFSKPQGVFYASDVNKLFVASGKDGTCKSFDGRTFALLSTEKLSLGADLVDYDRRSRQLYVGHGGKDAGNGYGELAIINAISGRKAANLQVEAHPGAILIGDDARVFVTVPDEGHILVLDRKTHAIQQNWAVEGNPHTTSVALDEAHHRLFVGTRKPAMIVVLDSESGKEVVRMPTVDTLDGIFFDRATRRIYASGGEGFVDVQQQTDPDHYEPVAHLATRANARTSLLVPEMRELMVAIPKAADQLAEIRVFKVRP
jgi:DNA-binding beta-propeller fold protein YncE